MDSMKRWTMGHAWPIAELQVSSRKRGSGITPRKLWEFKIFPGIVTTFLVRGSPGKCNVNVLVMGTPFWQLCNSENGVQMHCHLKRPNRLLTARLEIYDTEVSLQHCFCVSRNICMQVACSHVFFVLTDPFSGVTPVGLGQYPKVNFWELLRQDFYWSDALLVVQDQNTERRH